MKADFHTHTTASDGSFTPAELVRSAKESGITTLAVTDHDTVAGLDEAIYEGNNIGVQVIPGVEISVNTVAGSIHMLGYGFDHYNPELAETLKRLRHSRDDRNRKIVERLNELGYPLTEAEVAVYADGGNVGRGHFALCLVAKGFFPNPPAVFDALLSHGRPAYVGRYRLDICDAIALIHRVGGVAVWAHPGLHSPDELKDLLGNLPKWVECGLDGIETEYSAHHRNLAEQLAQTAARYGLIATGGSDFHGSLKPHIRLGQSTEGKPVPLEIAAQLLKRINPNRPITIN